MKMFNNSNMPSLNQIMEGLIAEAMSQLEQAMANFKEQNHLEQAKTNIKKTWELLFAQAVNAQI